MFSGAKPDQPADDGATALFSACSRGEKALVELLCDPLLCGDPRAQLAPPPQLVAGAPRSLADVRAGDAFEHAVVKNSRTVSVPVPPRSPAPRAARKRAKTTKKELDLRV